ncbi:sensor domain-containing diguanylate cyclase [Salidesulfovibrio brasiliensis]|uniref:sensor domain-containing diguanylate cyclase n=1 Tax=Salidesulfovibrio brasiliensis TaxID=221711 RepID=UPI0006CF5C5F|nr:diguanylate cyclase [Salidesulfovibrio brasiliensis]
MKNPVSTKAKLLFALTVILLGTFLLTSFINYHVARESVREELLNSSLPLTGKNIYSEIHTQMMHPILMAKSMAGDTFLWDWVHSGEQDVETIQKFLHEIKIKNGFLIAFYVSHISDKYYYNDGVLKRIHPRDPLDVWYYAFLRSKRPYELNVDHSEAEGGKLSVFVNHRVTDSEGRLLGVTGVGMDMSKAAELLRLAREKYEREVYLVDQEGLVQMHPDLDMVETFSIRKAEGLKELANEILTPREEPTTYEFDRGENHVLLSTHYIPEFDWYLLVEQNESTALAAARSNFYRTLTIGAVASLLIILLSILTVNHFQGRIEDLISTDALTGAVNRRGLDEAFEMAAYRTDRSGQPFSIILIDLDSFKRINDTLGHLEGDRVLGLSADGIRKTLRPTDTLGRWGGDEFLIMMEGGQGEAKAVAERVNDILGNLENGTSLTCSSGVAEYRVGETLDDLVLRADQAMYDAKAEGGSKVVIG